jgi:hypothetical protein
MNTVIKFGLCLFVIICLVGFTGCAKKSEPQPSTPTAAEVPQKPAISEPAKEIAKPAAPAPAASLKSKIDSLIAAPIDTVKAEVAQNSNVEMLKAKATEYKNAIAVKKEELTKEIAKLKEIPVAQQLSADAKTVQSNIKNLTKIVSDLTDKFQLYNNKIKELGGSTVELTK